MGHLISVLDHTVMGYYWKSRSIFISIKCNHFYSTDWPKYWWTEVMAVPWHTSSASRHHMLPKFLWLCFEHISFPIFAATFLWSRWVSGVWGTSTEQPATRILDYAFLIANGFHHASQWSAMIGTGNRLMGWAVLISDISFSYIILHFWRLLELLLINYRLSQIHQTRSISAALFIRSLISLT